MKDVKKRFNRLLALLVIPAVFVVSGCHFFEETIAPEPEIDPNSLVTGITFTVNTLNVNKGEKANFKVNINPSDVQNKVNISWECGKNEKDEEVIKLSADNYGAIVEGVRAGTTWVKAKCNGIVATCLISVISNGDDTEENPYIYSSDSVVEMLPDRTYTLMASLYGGSIEDMEDFVWEVKDPSVADIIPGRNNCIVKSKLPGSTTVTARHNKAKYEYTFIIYVYTDKLTIPYITTTNNVLTIDRNENAAKRIKVDLMNSYTSSYINDFKFEIADEDSKNVINISSSQNECEVRGLANGIARIKVTHPQSPDYPLYIVVRVNTIVKNVYVGLSQSTLVINGSEGIHSVTASVENYDGVVDLEKFTFDVPSEAASIMEWNVHGNVLSIQGKKNGKVTIKVGHELSEYKRTLLVILQEQIGSAVDSSMYITTDQNYVQTKVGDPVTRINVRLIGGIDGEDNVGDENQNFRWYVTGNYMSSSQKNDFVNFQEHTGYIYARSAASSGNICPAYIDINPVLEGEFTIHVAHPRCVYETEIKVHVLSEYALTEPPVKINTASSILKLLNGSSETIIPSLENATDADTNNITYESENPSVISVSPSKGPSTVINAVGSGSNQTYVNIHLDKAIADKKLLVLSADTQAALDAMKAMYADASYARLTAGTTSNISLNLVGFEDSDINAISFVSEDTSIVVINKDTVSSNPDGTKTASYKLSGVSKGRCYIKANYEGCPEVKIEVTVLPVGESPDVITAPKYLTTNLNAIVLEEINSEANLNVVGVNIENQTGYIWNKTELTETAPSEAFELYNSGSNFATVRAVKKGKASVKVSHPESQNDISINVKCGSLLEWTDGYIPYIVCENGEDVVNIVNGAPPVTIGCALANTDETGVFNWQVTQGAEKISIVGTINGTCTITPKEAGQAIITVSNSVAGDVTKEILVNVANSEEELKGFKYLTTVNNVVNVGQGQTKNVAVDIVNSDSPVIAGYFWSSADNSKATVTGAGNTASIYGKEIGTTKIIVQNNDCELPLEIIVNVVDPIAASQDPYISCPNIITCTVGGEAQDVSAELIGGSDSMSTGFSWSSEDTSVATVYGSNSSAKIKAVKEGVTRIVVQHPNADVPRRILVICEPKAETNCYITVTESIIKMAPSDSPKSITATLVNGNADDIYGFKWWADDYKIINMSPAQNECSITPIASGTVNIHVSHKKAQQQKDIVLYISQYNDFAFSENSIELETGGASKFIQMEVPATGVDCEVSFRSTKPEVCTAWGNTTVCSLTPGQEEGTCNIIATLKTKGGVVQGTAELVVATVKKNETRPYIGLEGQTVVSFNIEETKKLKARLYGSNLIDQDGHGLRWEIFKEYKNLIAFTANSIDEVSTGNSYVNGTECQIKAINNGKAVLKITHDDDNGRKISPLLVYVIVNGTAEPSISFNWPSMELYTGEESQELIANVLNNNGEDPEWQITQTPDDPNITECCSIVTNGLKSIITPVKPGKVDIKATLKSNGSMAQCTITVVEPPRLEFFVYEDEVNKTGERVIDRMNVYPGKSKNLYYRSVPKVKAIRPETAGHYLSDSNRISCTDLGYGKNGVPSNVGTVIVTGASMETETPVFYKLTTIENVEKSITLTNKYNYSFSVDKTAITMTVDEALNKRHDDEGRVVASGGHEPGWLGPVKYKITPSCAELDLLLSNDKIGNVGLMHHIPQIYYKSASGSFVKVNYDSSYRAVITEHMSTDPVSEQAEGEIWLKTDGEFFGTLTIFAVNRKLVSGSGETAHQIGNGVNINLSWYYTQHHFEVTDQSKDGAHSRYDANTNCIVIGDGETFNFALKCTDPSPDMRYQKIEMAYGNSMIKDMLGIFQSDSTGLRVVYGNQSKYEPDNTKYDCYVWHKFDYGGGGNPYYYRYGMAAANPAFESGNKTVKEYSYVGYLKITNILLDGEPEIYSIPVYAEIRNTEKSVQ